jgi:lysophospholipase L1-like esterase
MGIKLKLLLFAFISTGIFGTSCSEAQTTAETKITEKTSPKRATELIKPQDFHVFLDSLGAIVDTTHIRRFEKEIIKFEVQDSTTGFPENAYLFIGSSSIRKWHSLEDDMKPLQTINRGFGGSTMAEAIYYFPRIAEKYKSKAIILYEGDNDLSAAGMQPDIFLELFKLFTELRNEYLPDTKLYFLSIKPSPARLKHLEKMMEANELIRNYSMHYDDIFYIDISSCMFEEEGKIRKDIFLRDNLHLNDSGYKLWKQKLREVFLSE